MGQRLCVHTHIIPPRPDPGQDARLQFLAKVLQVLVVPTHYMEMSDMAER